MYMNKPLHINVPDRPYVQASIRVQKKAPRITFLVCENPFYQISGPVLKKDCSNVSGRTIQVMRILIQVIKIDRLMHR